jgi:hypothetical protein
VGRRDHRVEIYDFAGGDASSVFHSQHRSSPGLKRLGVEGPNDLNVIRRSSPPDAQRCQTMGREFVSTNPLTFRSVRRYSDRIDSVRN